MPGPAAPRPLKRESAGRYTTADGRFTIDRASGGWVVSDSEHLNELGLPLIRGPFATLDEARTAIDAARDVPAPTSDLAARMAALPPAEPKPRGGRGASSAPSRPRSAARRVASRSAPQPPPVVVREWRTGDGQGLRRLWSEVGMDSIGDDDAGLAAMAHRNPGLVLVATVEDVVVGSALGGWDGRRGWIYHVATSPAHRRRGIARRLVAQIEDGLRRVGCRKVNVIVFEDNGEAVAFWETAGYSRSPTRQYGRELASTARAGRSSS